MSLTLTGAELIRAAPALQAIGGYSLPNAKASYALTRIKRVAQAELTDLETERIARCEEFAAKDDNGVSRKSDAGGYDIPPDSPFHAMWASVLAEPVPLTGCRAVTVDELEGATMVVRFPDDPKRIEVVRGIPSDVLFALGPIVDEGPPVPAAP